MHSRLTTLRACLLPLLVCLLLAFYTVESLQRERARGLAPIHYATPLPSASPHTTRFAK